MTVALVDARARFDLPLDALELLDRRRRARRARHPVRDVRRARRLLPATWPARSGGCAWRSSPRADGNGHATLADDLGVAMQLTNILRDVREDYELGRVYLPAEDLRRFGCSAPPEMSAELIRFEAARAREWFDRGLGLVDVLDARSASCVLAMTGIYRRILERIARRAGRGPASGGSRCRRGRRRGWRREACWARTRPDRRAWLERGREADRGRRRRARGDRRGARLRARRRAASRCSSRVGASAAPPTRSPATASSPTTASTCSCAAAPRTGSCSIGSERPTW